LGNVDHASEQELGYDPAKPVTIPDLPSQISDYEDGNLDEEETLSLFGRLIKSGLAWQLQGSYGRMAKALIDGGYLSPKGDILKC